MIDMQIWYIVIYNVAVYNVSFKRVHKYKT